MTLKNTRPILWAISLLLTATTHPLQAADGAKRIKYVPPAGFGGHVWGELRTSPGFQSLPEKPYGIGAAWMRPVETDIAFACVPASGGGCDLQATLDTLRRRFEGGGFYVLSEYRIEDQGGRFAGDEDGVLLYPMVYQFCANWDSLEREVPPKFDELNKFCGMRLMFKSETAAELRNLPADHVTNYDRVLDKLISKFGKPDRFVRRGRVSIETLEGDAGDRRERKFSVWRWCPARDRGLRTSCTASVVLSLDLEAGTGTVLYSTPLLWEYAYARQNNGHKGDYLFRMLHTRR